MSYEVKIDDSHNLMVIKRKSSLIDDETYEFYIMATDENIETPYHYIYAISASNRDLDAAIELAILNAPSYYHLLED